MVRAMTTIELPSDLATALQAKATAQGISLQEWLRDLAAPDEPPNRRRKYSLEELLAQCDLSAPLPEEDKAWV